MNIFLLSNNTCVLQISAIISVSQDSRGPLAQSRPKCNSVLHLFGEWLFEAAHIGGETWLQNIKSNKNFICFCTRFVLK